MKSCERGDGPWKKSTYSGFELFRVKEPDCPMEVLELPDKNQKIVAFAWEPKVGEGRW